MTASTPPTRVLVVDDEAAVAAVLRAFLEHLGVSATTVNDFATARSLLATAGWDLLVTDFQLGDDGHTGLELVRAARESCPGIRTLLVSGSLSRDHVLPRDGDGADEFLSKPVSFASFAAAVQRLLGIAAS